MTSSRPLYGLTVEPLTNMNQRAHQGGGTETVEVASGEGLVEDQYEAHLKNLYVAYREPTAAKIAELASKLEKLGCAKLAEQVDEVLAGYFSPELVKMAVRPPTIQEQMDSQDRADAAEKATGKEKIIPDLELLQQASASAGEKAKDAETRLGQIEEKFKNATLPSERRLLARERDTIAKELRAAEKSALQAEQAVSKARRAKSISDWATKVKGVGTRMVGKGKVPSAVPAAAPVVAEEAGAATSTAAGAAETAAETGGAEFAAQELAQSGSAVSRKAEAAVTKGLQVAVGRGGPLSSLALRLQPYLLGAIKLPILGEYGLAGMGAGGVATIAAGVVGSFFVGWEIGSILDKYTGVGSWFQKLYEWVAGSGDRGWKDAIDMVGDNLKALEGSKNLDDARHKLAMAHSGVATLLKQNLDEEEKKAVAGLGAEIDKIDTELGTQLAAYLSSKAKSADAAAGSISERQKGDSTVSTIQQILLSPPWNKQISSDPNRKTPDGGWGEYSNKALQEVAATMASNTDPKQQQQGKQLQELSKGDPAATSANLGLVLSLLRGDQPSAAAPAASGHRPTNQDQGQYYFDVQTSTGTHNLMLYQKMLESPANFENWMIANDLLDPSLTGQDRAKAIHDIASAVGQTLDQAKLSDWAVQARDFGVQLYKQHSEAKSAIDYIKQTYSQQFGQASDVVKTQIAQGIVQPMVLRNIVGPDGVIENMSRFLAELETIGAGNYIERTVGKSGGGK